MGTHIVPRHIMYAYIPRHSLHTTLSLITLSLITFFRFIFIRNSITKTRVRNGHLVYWQMLIARAYRTTGLVQSTEQKELALSESLTNWILEDFIVKIGKIHCITVANGLSTGTVPDKKKTIKNQPLGMRKTCRNAFLIWCNGTRPRGRGTLPYIWSVP